MNIQDRMKYEKKRRIKPTKDIIFTIQHSCLLDSYSKWTIKQYINSETDFFRIEKVAFIPSSNEMILGCQLQWRPWRWCQSYWLGMRLSSSFSCLYALVGTWIQKAGRFATPFGIGREHLTMVLTDTARRLWRRTRLCDRLCNCMVTEVMGASKPPDWDDLWEVH